MDIISLIIILGLIGFCFYKERKQEQIIKELLAFKLSKSATEFQATIEEKPKEETPKEEEVLPIEEAPPEKLLEALKK